jgi:hypothetical protein
LISHLFFVPLECDSHATAISRHLRHNSSIHPLAKTLAKGLATCHASSVREAFDARLPLA